LAGTALTVAIASRSVPSASGLAALLKPTWLSLIWRKVSLGSECVAEVAVAEEAQGFRHAAR
jgi:hypothetical protein